MAQQKLIILDDEMMVGQTIKTIAESAGFNVRLTTVPDDFFTEVEAFHPDCIALDLVMPGMDGVQIMESLARQRCTARIIVTSGSGHRVLEAAGRAARENGLDIVGVLHKPFRPAELRALLSAGAEAPQATSTPVLPQSEITQPAHAQALSEQDLAGALRKKEIFVAYQPKIDCRSGAVAGFEALARWRHPERGLIGPDSFIPLAERHGLIDPLTEYVFGEALEWFSGLLAANHSVARAQPGRAWFGNLTLSINISALSLGNQAMFERLIALMQSFGLAPERVIFELTESSAMEDRAASLGFLTRLRIKGFHLSLDDFGTGFSSMLQLVRLPFSEIKVDKSFVMTTASSQESRSVIKSIIDLGKSLGLRSTAEGVEDEAVVRYLKEIGCDLLQGYLISPPLQGHEAVAWVAERSRAGEAKRLEALHRLGILDTPAEERFDRITRLAKRIFGVPVALVSFVDADRQWFKSVQGLTFNETPRDISFCTHTVQDEQVFVVRDAAKDPAFRDNPLVKGEPQTRFYAGCPVSAEDGSRIGTLCIIDSQPRLFNEEDARALCDLAAMVEKELAAERALTSDPLTSVLTREAFEKRAEELIELCGAHGRGVTLVLFDLDGFTHINQQYGHLEGDEVLKSFARMLGETFRGSDLIARFGGDEFVVLASGVEAAHADELVGRLKARLGQYNEQRARAHPVSFSFGVASCGPGDTYGYQRLLGHADHAMYELKRGPT